MFYVLVRQARTGPSIDQGVGEPNDEKRGDAGKDDIGWEMGAGHDANCRHAGPERESGTVGDGAPLRRRQGCGRDSPKRAGNVARYKSAIVRTAAAGIPPGNILLVATKLHHVDWPRPTPM